MTNVVKFHNSDLLVADAKSPERQYNLRHLNLSTVEKTNIELPHDLYVNNGSCDGEFDVDSRDKIIARLREIPTITGCTDGEIADAIGISRSLWSNYKAENTDVTIRPRAALELSRVFGIPMEWIYGGELSQAVPEMRAQLALANRRAEAWLGSRRPPQGTGKPYRAVLALMVGAGLSLFVGFHDLGYAVSSMPALPTDRESYLEGRGDCHKKAGAMTLDYAATVEEYDAIYTGCMAQRGLLAQVEFPESRNWFPGNHYRP